MECRLAASRLAGVGRWVWRVTDSPGGGARGSTIGASCSTKTLFAVMSSTSDYDFGRSPLGRGLWPDFSDGPSAGARDSQNLTLGAT